MTTQRKKISVVVPVFNEEGNLARFHSQMSAAVAELNYDFSFVFVNDGSRDKSVDVLKGLLALDPRIVIINLSRNFGSYGAIEAGMTYAAKDSAAIMCISADLQDPPEIVQKFVPLWESGHHTVWGTRAERDDPFFKSLYASLFYWFVRKAAFPNFPADGMDIGLFDKTVIDHYLAIGDRNSIPFFTIYSLGFKQAEVPYKRAARFSGESGWPFWKRVKCAVDIAVSFSYVPIRTIPLIGATLAIFAFAYGSIIIFQKLVFDVGISGWSSIAVLTSFIGGVQMMFLGIIAEYLWRTNDRVKNTPVYIVMDTFKRDSSL